MSTGGATRLDVADLRDRVRGTVLGPTDDGYEESRSAWNLAVPQNVAAVAVAEGPDDVVAAVDFARRRGLAIAAQPLGHSATPALDGTLLLRTGAMREVTVDAAARTARIQAGASWQNVLQCTTEHRLTGLAGSSSAVTAVAYTLGGGLSWFGRKHGWAANRVRSFEAVDAAGVARTVTAESDPDLFWALRGGGGDFAIVTEMEIDLVPADHIYGGRLAWPQDAARDVLNIFRELAPSLPEEMSVWYTLFNLPDIEMVPEPIRGKSLVAIDAAFLGSTEEGARLLAPFRHVGGDVLDTFGTYTPDRVTDIAAEPVEPMPAMEFSRLLTRLDTGADAAMLDTIGPGTESPVVAMQVRHLGGALARRVDGGGAVEPVAEPFIAFGFGVPMIPELGQAIAARYAALGEALAPYASRRSYFNFLDEHGAAYQAFGSATLERLRAIKRQRDPDGVFRSNRPVLAQPPVPQQR